MQSTAFLFIDILKLENNTYLTEITGMTWYVLSFNFCCTKQDYTIYLP